MNTTLDRLVPPVRLTPGCCGDYAIERFTVSPEQESIERVRAMFSFTSQGRYVPAGTYSRLVGPHRTIWMSDTPNERRDQLPAIYAAKGDCLIGGLGLGITAQAFLQKPEVTTVTVVEIEPAIIVLVGWPLEAVYWPRLQILWGDFLTWKPPRSAHYGAVWCDIWPALSSDNLPAMARLNRRYAQKADWVGCWGQEECRDLRRN